MAIALARSVDLFDSHHMCLSLSLSLSMLRHMPLPTPGEDEHYIPFSEALKNSTSGKCNQGGANICIPVQSQSK